jgi:hypothetical protein
LSADGGTLEALLKVDRDDTLTDRRTAAHGAEPFNGGSFGKNPLRTAVGVDVA